MATYSKLPRKKASGPAQAVSHVLAQVSRNLNLDFKTREWSVFQLWEANLDPSFQGKTQAVQVQQKTHSNGFSQQTRLRVLVASATVASELGFYLEKMQEKLNAYAPQTGITLHGIDLRVGSIISRKDTFPSKDSL